MAFIYQKKVYIIDLYVNPPEDKFWKFCKDHTDEVKNSSIANLGALMMGFADTYSGTSEA